MRLWHKDLIPVLPRQQLLGQWRECCAIMANIEKNGTPNHVLVNKVMDYDLSHFLWYSNDVAKEMQRKGFHPDVVSFWQRHGQVTGAEKGTGRLPLPVPRSKQFEGWHNDRYLTQCYYNLQEKYDCGAITDDEWQKIEERCLELLGDVI